MNTNIYPNIGKNYNLDKFVSELLTTQGDSEKKVDSFIRKSTGLFLTNKLQTIDKILNIIPINEEILNKLILEPSCGEGIFLLRILIKVYERFPDKKIIKRFIENNLNFVDIGEIMIEKTKNNISSLYKLFFNEEYEGRFNGFGQDFTKKFIENKETLFRIENLEHPLAKLLGKVDYVVGNPPYVSLYGRRDKKKTEKQRIYYLTNYDQFPSDLENGKINLVMLFIEHALDFLKKDGKLSLIVDVSFFETAYKYTRRYLLKNTVINSLDINIKDFDVASGQIIVKLTKNSDNKSNEVNIIDNSNQKIYKVKQYLWFNPDDEYKFRFNHQGEARFILRKILDKNDMPISKIYSHKNLRTCAMLLDMEDRFTYKNPTDKNKNLIFAYYEGSKSLGEKYCNLRFSKYFYYDKQLQNLINDQLKIELAAQGIKNKKRIGLGDIVAYENPKIFIRQSAKKIIATLDMKRSAANNSLYIFTLRSNSSESISKLQFICGWLNSKLITFYSQFMDIIRFSNGKQPQIKIADLGSIPLPSNEDLQNKIVKCVSIIYNNPEILTEETNVIDNLIYNYYELSESEIHYLEESIKAF